MFEAYLSTLIPAGFAAAVSATGYLIKKVNDTDKAFTAHVASDLVTFKAFSQNFDDLKASQRDQTQKLDRLIEGMLDDKRKAS